MSAAFVALSTHALPNLARGEILLSDGDFLQSNYTESNQGVAVDIRYNFDYSNFSIFDGFLNVNVPPSPRGGGSTTGLFMTANNDSFQTGAASLASVTRNGVNVGNGTDNPNYRVRIDVFNSTGNGIIDGQGTLTNNTQLTTYSYVGLNQASTTVQIGELNSPGGGVNASGQGMGLLITADGGAGDDYLPIYGGVRYIDRALTDPAGVQRSQTSGVEHTGLLGRHLAYYWETQGFEFTETDDPADTSNNLIRTPGDGGYFAPDPSDPEGWTFSTAGPHKPLFLDVFPKHDTPLHYSGGVTAPSTLAPNTSHLTGGTPYNQWATHELYWVDGTFTYVVTYDGNTIPLLQFTPGAEDMTVFDPYSDAGTVALAFYDRFSSIAVGPEGANFVIYDNLEIEAFDEENPAPEIDIMQYLVANGFTIDEGGLPGDFDGNEVVDGRDFLLWQRDPSVGNLSDWQTNYGPGGGGLAAVTVPEPASLALVGSLAAMCLLGVRRH